MSPSPSPSLLSHLLLCYNLIMKKPLLVLFDGNAIVHRAYHAFQTSRSPVRLTVSKTGEVVSAVYGFTQMLLKTLNTLKPTHCAIAFDKKGPTFRHQLFDQYKAHRPPTPPELISQLDRVRQMVEAFRIPIFELDSYEADDLLGTLSHQASKQDVDTIIVTGDADAMQLVSPRVKVLYPEHRKSFSDAVLFDEAAVTRKYGVKPEQITDLKGLVGDPSDNIPGVPSVGEKTAVKLLQRFGTVENIYDHIDEVTPPRLQETMRQNEELARQSKHLATIVIEAPAELKLNECQMGHYDRETVNELFRELEFVRLRDRLPEVGAGAETSESPPAEVKTRPPQGEYHIVNTPSDLDNLVNRLAEAKSFAFDLETTSLNPMYADLVGLSFSPAPAEAYYVPVGHTSLQSTAQLPLPQVIDRLKPVLEDKGLAKLAHNGKYDMTVLAELGINVNNLTFDTMVAAYLMGEK